MTFTEYVTSELAHYQFHLHEGAPQLVVLRQLVTEEVICVGRRRVTCSARLAGCTEHHTVISQFQVTQLSPVQDISAIPKVLLP